MKEMDVMRACMLALSEAGCLIWRNNVGVLPDRNGVPIRFGLCVGSADLIGIAPDGRFLAVEVKTKTGRVRPEQQRFIDAVNAKGGIAGVARSAEEALDLLRRG
jgi:hypothetical protein